MSKDKIFHIYWGTAGNAGLYMDEIYQAINKMGYQQKAFVNYYYPFNYGDKVFFKRTEMEHSKYTGLLRKIVQAYEFLLALSQIYFYVIKDKPRIVNYSYVSRGNLLILYFLKFVKKIRGLLLVITCHDVIPITESKMEYERELSIKRKIYAIADYYLVHTNKSCEELREIFFVEAERVLKHPFPLMDLSKLDNKREKKGIIYDFLFIGHMRPEKGVSILIEAWQKFYEQYPESRLCLAGNPNHYKEYLAEKAEWCKNHNVELILRFINDEEYIDIIKSARCVVFPYTGGTNSGVISTVVSLSRDIITSDLGMFENNPFVPKENMFKVGDTNSLVEKLIAYKNGELVSDCSQRVSEYRKIFKEQVCNVYSFLLNSKK